MIKNIIGLMLFYIGSWITVVSMSFIDKKTYREELMKMMSDIWGSKNG